MANAMTNVRSVLRSSRHRKDAEALRTVVCLLALAETLIAVHDLSDAWMHPRSFFYGFLSWGLVYARLKRSTW